jgi:carbon-monoxide dehydrogenase medium subunit
MSNHTLYPFYAAPTTLDEALRLKAEHGENARILAGGTDLLIELDRGGRKTPDGHTPGLIDLTHIPGLTEIWEADGWVHLGPLVTHNQCVASSLLVKKAFPLVRACWEVGAPQIRNRATVAGNLITASPANDAITPLLALDATVTVRSAARGDRHMTLDRFIMGFRRVDLRPDEILVRISFRGLTAQHDGLFIKLGLRHAQAISVLNVATVIQYEQAPGSSVKQAKISLGAVAPSVVRAKPAEAYLAGQPLSDAVIAETARLATQSTSPIDDVRASADYRLSMVETLVARSLRQIRQGQSRAGWTNNPVLLWGATNGRWPVAPQERGKQGDEGTRGEGNKKASEVIGNSPFTVHDSQLATRSSPFAHVNGHPVELASGMTLLNSLRIAGFTGVKEGCAEGECGACTVFLDGMAVMACLVPSERAKGSQVITVEGLGAEGQLHPVQAALVQSGGVQCGYCTPGFVMSAAKLLEERPQPTRAEAEQAFTGNLCRCTGYRKILDAVVAAGAHQQSVVDETYIGHSPTDSAPTLSSPQ